MGRSAGAAADVSQRPQWGAGGRLLLFWRAAARVGDRGAQLFPARLRTGDVTRMDTGLFDTLVQLHAATGADKRAGFTLISGYRSPRTNGRLHEHSDGVASKSQHMRGKAVDISLKSVRLSNLQKAALSLRAGGVGYYPEDGFVHVDTGPVRRW